ncbi:MAG: phytoene desaturase family protein [Acidobacteriaceae bacterium]
MTQAGTSAQLLETRNPQHKQLIAIIGAGLAGLASACVLAARGYQVTVFEANSWTGGKAAQLTAHGYRFDMGPTILIQPKVLRKIFSEAGRRLEDYLDLLPLEPQWRCFYEDGVVLELAKDEAATAAQIETIAPGNGEGYRKFLEVSRQLHRISNDFFFWRPVGGMLDTLDLKGSFNLNTLRDVLNMRLGSSVSGVIQKHVSDRRAAQMLEHFVQYVGSAPDQSPAILCAIGAMQMEEGIWYPLGGTRAVPQALRKLGEELGVTYRANAKVDRIISRDGKAAAIALHSGEQVAVAAVISNADAVRTHRELLPGTAAAENFASRRKYEPSCSGVVLYLGLDRRYPQLLHHNFVFSHTPEEEFDFIYRKGEPAPDPTCYLCAPAATESAVAPPDGEALYILVHTPYLRPHHDWKKMLPAYREVILDKLERNAGLKDIRRHIKFEAHLTPQDIHDRYRVLNGAIYGIASHGKLQGGFKPSNVSPDLKNLFLAGGAAHPGPGMPMVLMSGWIAADALDNSGVVEKSNVAAL